MYRLLILCSVATFACSDQAFSKVEAAEGDANPEIDVTPPSLDFGALADGDAAVVKQFTIYSVGGTDLTIDQIEVTGSDPGSFTILSETDFILPAGAEQVIDVAFLPVGGAAQSGTIIVHSDDEDDGLWPVALLGEGLVPELQIDPNPLAFGDHGVGCDTSERLTLENVGTEDLIISALDFSATDMTLVETPNVPMTLAPGDQQSLLVTFAPTEEATRSGALTVTSNEPIGTRTATQTGAGTLDPHDYTEEWTLPANPPTDILFSLDSSCSMSADAWELYNNFDAFINELEGWSTDWQLIVVNEDDGCNNSGILKPSLPDYRERFQEALFAWNFNDDYTEALLTVNEAAVQQTDSGECNAGFMRPDAMLHIIDISDEPEQSEYISGRTWDELLDSIMLKKGNAALTTVSAIAGDYPGGCSDAAEGYGYWQAVDATNGVFLSICQNWSSASNLGMLAEASVSQSTFVLAREPNPDSIEVFVNEQRRSTWEYKDTINAIVFTSDPPGEADIVRADYSTTGTCGD